MAGYDPNLDFFALLRPSVGSQLVRRMPILDLVMSAFGQSNLISLYVGYTPPTVNQATTLWLLPQNPSWQGPGTLYLWDQTQNNGAGGYVLATPTLFAILLHAMLPQTQQGIWINRQIFKTVGTAVYNPTFGTDFINVRVIGGGGGGGAAGTTGAGQVRGAGGGGAGGYAEKRIFSGFAGVTVTVGAAGVGGVANGANGTSGGTSSFGSFVSATGGGGNGNPAAQTPPIITSQGQPAGVGSGGDINGGGLPGSQAFALQPYSVTGGLGGYLVPYGQGGQGFSTSGATSGNSGQGWGAGGGGGACAQSQGGAGGGAGTQGVVIVDEYA